jgi:glycosyltransferase involved in cell wall biosynthesis
MKSSKRVKVAMVCKLMPLYRLGVFQQLSACKGDLEFTFFGDTKNQGGIEIIDWQFDKKINNQKINWIKTKNYFYKPENLLWQTGIIKEIFKSEYKVFVFEGAIAHYPIWLFAALCKLFGKKVLFWTHGNRGLDKGLKKFLRFLLFKKLGDGLLLYGNHQRDYMIKDGYDPNKLFVIYNSLQPQKQFESIDSLDKSLIHKEKDQLFKYSNAFTLIFIGRLVKGKKVLDIVNAISILKNKGIITNCIFIGSGPEEQKIIDFSKKMKIENQVYFTGALYNENDIARYFSMSDLMISPGNVGLNCIHSLAYGIPVLTHDNFTYQNPEVEAITEGKTGTFYKYQNIDDMIIKLENWIIKNKDEEEIFNNCQNVIKAIFNPSNQSKCIVDGVTQTLNSGK